jgi:hypothetical protein
LEAFKNYNVKPDEEGASKADQGGVTQAVVRSKLCFNCLMQQDWFCDLDHR